MTSRKLSASIAVLILLALLVSACAAPAAPQPAAAPTEAAVEPAAEPAAATEPAPTEAAAEPAAEPVTIQIFYPVAVDAPIADILNGYVEQFEAENPGITVEPVFSGGYTDVRTAIQTTIDGGGQPPAAAVMLATDLYDLINADYIAPLDGYINAMPDGEAYLNDFFPVFLDNSRYDNQIWSIPFQRSDVVLYYNADLLAEAGLEPPDSWQSWAEAAQALTVREGDNVTRWGLQFSSDWPYWLFQPLAIGAGQNIFTDDTTVNFDDPAVVEAAQFYIDLSKVYGAMPEGVQANWGQGPADIASGQTAMVVHSSGSLASILGQADFEVGVMPIPGKEAGTFASVPGGGNLYILKGAPQEQQDAAWKFIEFLSRPELAADYSIQTGYVASRQSAYDTEAMQAYLQEVPQAALTRDALQFAGAEFSIQNLGEVRSILHDYLQRAFNGEMTPGEAMAAAQAAADEALADFR
jgi:sn-glycerol 3-phosphate transport system substrate-binding protein